MEAAWRAVYRADPEAQFFLSWDWLNGVFEDHPGKCMVLMARGPHDDRPLAFLPLRCSTAWSSSQELIRNELHFAGRLSWGDYGGVLCLPDWEEAALPELARFLKRMSWSHLYLKEFRISDRRFDLFMAPFADERLAVESRTSLINHGTTNNLVCPYIDLPPSFEDYLSTRLSTNTRQRMRRFLRKVESSGGEYQVTAATEETRERDVGILELLWSDTWKGRKGPETEWRAAKHARIVGRGLKENLARLIILWRAGKPVGAVASFLDREKSRVLFFVSGRDRNFDAIPGGLVLHGYNIRWAIENAFRTYDFLRGDEPYKFQLGAERAYLRSMLVRTKSRGNLNGRLDSSSLEEALQIAIDFAKQGEDRLSLAACRQILALWPGNPHGTRLLRLLTGEGG